MNTTGIDRTNGRRRSPVRMAILLVALMLGHGLAQPRVARAQEAESFDWHGSDGWFAVMLLEAPLLVGPTLSLWRLGDRPELVPHASVLLAAGSGVTWMRYARGLDPAAPLVMHGVLWGELEGLLVGALIDGRSDDGGLRIGPWAYGLATAGAVAGGWLAASKIEADQPNGDWVIGPIAGGGGGLVFGFLATALIDSNSRRRGIEMSLRARRQTILWCVAGGIAIGTAIGMASTNVWESESDTAQPPAMQAKAAMLRLPPIRF
jgi:hypothetical protein